MREKFDELARLHTAATKYYGDGEKYLTANVDKAMEWANSSFRAFPALLECLRGLEGELDRLRLRDNKLSCLEAGGVDNWDGYDFAMEEYDK